MTVLTASVAAASVVIPLVIHGEQLGELHDAGCSDQPVESFFGSLAEAGRAPTRTAPIVIDTGELLAPDPNTRYVVTAGGPSLPALVRALTFGGRPIYDIMVPGRYDLALNRERLRLLTEQAGLPWTVANLSPRFASQPHRVVERDGVRVGLTGVIDDRLRASLHPRVRPEDLRSARESLGEAVKALRAKNVDLVVAVSHQPSSTALRSILRLVDGVEDRPDVLVMSPIAGAVQQVGLGPRGPIVLAAPTGTDRALVAHIEARRGGVPRFLGARFVTLQARPDRALADVRREVCEALGRPIGPAVSRKDGRPRITREAFVQFVLELIRREANAEVAVINRGTVRDVFPVPPRLTPLDLMQLLPFDDGIQVADVPGIAMSNLSRLASDGRARVSGIDSEGRVAGRALDTGRTYRVATVDFVAEGGDEIFLPEELEWSPAEDLGDLRDLVADYLRDHGFDPDADPDPDDDVREPTLLSAQLNLGGDLKTVTVSNGGDYEAPQLSRDDFLGVTALFDLRVIADWARHKLQLFERTRYGIIVRDDDTEENDDVTTIELTYIGRFASKAAPWYVPNASAAASLETELTVPGEGEAERDYRRALLQAGVGPSFPLLSNISARVQLGLRRELLASPGADDEQERLLAETRMALLSTLEILQYTFERGAGRPLLSATLRVDHAFDLTGSVRDNLLQGRLDIDVPILRRLSITFGVELYFLDRAVDEGEDPGSGLAIDTSLGIKTFGDLSTVLF